MQQKARPFPETGAADRALALRCQQPEATATAGNHLPGFLAKSILVRYAS
jgi:hypothetical protein